MSQTHANVGKALSNYARRRHCGSSMTSNPFRSSHDYGPVCGFVGTLVTDRRDTSFGSGMRTALASRPRIFNVAFSRQYGMTGSLS